MPDKLKVALITCNVLFRYPTIGMPDKLGVLYAYDFIVSIFRTARFALANRAFSLCVRVQEIHESFRIVYQLT